MFCNYGTDFLLGLVDHVLLLWHPFSSPCRPWFAIMALIYGTVSTMVCHYGTDLRRRVDNVLSLWH